jgi:hypothetical protein
MNTSPQDIQIVILSYFEPKDIITLYNVNPFFLNDLKTYFAFTIHCYKIVSDEIITWFQQHNIPLQLFKEYKINEDRSQQIWYLNGKIHRDDDLPAVINSNGTQIWYQHGKTHRDGDQPAINQNNGTQHWLLHDNYYTRPNNLPSILYPPHVESLNMYYRNGKLSIW